MITLPPKRPNEVRRYVFDWSRQLGDDTISAFQVAITSGPVTIQDSEQIDETKLSVLLAGGVDGQTSTFEIQMTTAAGQLLVRDFSILTANASNASGGLPSSTTKGQIMNMAWEEITLAGYEFDATPAEQATALQRLDSLMALWAGPGMNLDLGYNFPQTIGGSAQADPSGIPDLALDGVVLTLAQSLAGVIGKTLSGESRARLAVGMRAIRAAFVKIPHMHLPASTARGAGGKPWSTWRPFMGACGAAYGGGNPSTGSTPQPAALATESGILIGTEDGGIIGV
jgi:hypothetical protein